MLGKLIKYEFKATGKIFLLFYAGLIFMALLNMLIMPWGQIGNSDIFMNSYVPGETLELMKNLAQGAVFIMYIVAAIAVGVVTLIAVILRFYKMLGDEGYLMFTLPVSTSTQIFSKLIVATVWYLCSTIVIMLSIFIVIGRVDYFANIADFFREASAMGLHPGTWVTLTIIAVILSMAVGTLELYLAMTLGTHITKSRIGGSIIGYIIVATVTQIISTIAMVPLSFSFNFIENDPVSTATPADIEWHIVSTLSIYTFSILLLFGIGSYFITHHLMKNKLNLG